MSDAETVMQEAFRSSPVPQALLSRELRLVEWNVLFAELVPGCSSGALLHQLLPAEVATDTYALCLSVAQSQTREGCIALHLSGCPDPTLLSATLLPLSGSTSRILVTLRLALSADHEVDRTLRIDLERRLAAKVEELERTQKELESFSYSVSHDLRSPLRAVLGYSSALQEDYSELVGDEGNDYLRRIASAARRMDDLITAILSVSRVSRARMDRIHIDLTEFASQVCSELQPRFKSVQFRVQPGLEVYADIDLLRIMLQNLLHNACKFSAEGIAPEVEIGRAPEIGGSPIYVKDNGIGFDQQYAEKIFEPFERLNSEAKYPGTGIGLANVRRIVERHNGTVWAVGEPGSGSSFFFTLG